MIRIVCLITVAMNFVSCTSGKEMRAPCGPLTSYAEAGDPCGPLKSINGSPFDEILGIIE